MWPNTIAQEHYHYFPGYVLQLYVSIYENRKIFHFECFIAYSAETFNNHLKTFNNLALININVLAVHANVTLVENA